MTLSESRNFVRLSARLSRHTSVCLRPRSPIGHLISLIHRKAYSRPLRNTLRSFQLFARASIRISCGGSRLMQGAPVLQSTVLTSPAARWTFTLAAIRWIRKIQIAPSRLRQRFINGSCATLNASAFALTFMSRGIGNTLSKSLNRLERESHLQFQSPVVGAL